MATAGKHAKRQPQAMEIATFSVGNAQCGMNIMDIREINTCDRFTPVPLAPDYVLGVINLRGRVVTIIDLAEKLGLGATPRTAETRTIVVGSADGDTGFLVSRIGDIVAVSADAQEPPPANMSGIEGRFFSRTCKTETALIGLLDIEKTLSDEE